MNLIGNLRKQSIEYGLPVWKLPDVMLVFMAFINIAIMVATYIIFSRFTEDPRQAVLIVAAESALIMVVGNIIVETSKNIARVNSLKKDFIDIISHQMRTPLVSTKWHLEMMGKNKDLDERQLKYLNIALGSNNKVLALFNDLMNIENIEEKQIQYNPEMVDFEQAIEEVIQNNLAMAKSKNIKINSKKSKRTVHKAYIDKTKLKVILDNLLNNAIKYTFPNGIIDIDLRKRNNEIICKIKDSGIGIGDDEKGNIFQKFYRSKSSQKINVEGTGLGLYICKFLTVDMGGRISFESEKDKGTAFILSFPVHK